MEIKEKKTNGLKVSFIPFEAQEFTKRSEKTVVFMTKTILAATLISTIFLIQILIVS